MRRIGFYILLFVLIAGGLILVNQLLLLADFATRLSPTLGSIVFWSLLVGLLAVIIYPIFLIIRLPKALRPPSSEDHRDFPKHLERLRKRLRRNPLVVDFPLESRDELKAAFDHLDEEATVCIRRASSRIFLATAVSQNGALDALVVLGLQTKLVLEIARVYSQRPGVSDLIHLYGNVFATSFVAAGLDDMDASKVMEPAISAVLGSAAGLVPGLQVASTVFVNSVLTGTANAFLTLRVGVIAREYSRCWTSADRRSLRRFAMVQAGLLLGKIVRDGAKEISSAIGRGVGRATSDAVSSTGRAVKDAVTETGRSVGSMVTNTGKQMASLGSKLMGSHSKKD
jgi:hypothetical protein